MTLSALLVTLIAVFQQPEAPIAAPKLELKAFAAQRSVAPATTVDIVLQLDIPKPWHMYHAITLDTGIPTEFTFDLPAEATIGEVRFPTPEFGSKEGIEFLELKGRVLLVAPLTVAKSAKPGTELKIGVSVRGLACIEQCVPVNASTKLVAPVSAAPGADAEAELFKAARGKLTPRLADAPYLLGSRLEVSRETLKIGESAELIATIKVEAGHHIQDRDPGVAGLIASRFFIEHVDGIEFEPAEKQVWPTAKFENAPGVGRARTQAGEVKIRIPFKISDEKFPAGPVSMRVLFQYQCCKDGGQCFPPAMAEQTVRFVADTPNERQPKLGAAAPRGDGEPIAARPATPHRVPTAAVGMTLWLAVILAFIGGLIMNITPCVLPVLSIKVASFVEQSGDHPERILRLGLAFAAGVIVWFWIMGAVAVFGSDALRGQFQNPLQNVTIVQILSSIIFLMALNMFGVFEITLPGAAAGKLDDVTRREGYSGAFAKGLLATVLGTACTAPFMGAAFAFALTQTAGLALLVFTVAGVGMASPYVVLAANPKWMRFVPRPGMWMVTFKQSMGFLLALTAVWLLWVMRKQVGADGVVLFAGFWVFLALGAWLIGKIKLTTTATKAALTWCFAIAIGTVGYSATMRWLYEPPKAREAATAAHFDQKKLESLVKQVRAADWKKIPWIEYEPGLAQALSRAGFAVYVDFTADWCLNCKVNTNFVLETDEIRGQMQKLGMIPIEADFSGEDPAMREDINSDGRLSVPVNRVYAPHKPDEHELLPELLTTGLVAEALRKAGASQDVREASISRSGP